MLTSCESWTFTRERNEATLYALGVSPVSFENAVEMKTAHPDLLRELGQIGHHIGGIDQSASLGNGFCMLELQRM